MVLVHVEVAPGMQLQIKSAVLGKKLEHVVEKPDPGRDLVSPSALDAESAPNLGLLRVALNGG